MISKKSRKVVAALLIGATVCASGTFAYFNQKIDLSKISSVADGTDRTLQITNGKIDISAKFAGTTQTDLTSLWSYDVAKVSTANALIDGTDAKTLGTTAALGQADSATRVADTITNLVGDNAYITKHRTPDLKKVTSTQGGDGQTIESKSAFSDSDYTDFTSIKRLNIGTAIPSKVANARPGDAFVLGYVDNGTTPENAGVEIVNKSNLTTKIGVGLNPGKNGDYAEVKAEVAKLNANGWKVYVRVIDAGTKEGIGTYKDWKEITQGLGEGTDGICEVATVAPESGVNPLIQLRVELPLLADNKYQDLKTGKSPTGGTEGTFDVTSLFEIVATQENNPGWNQDGTSKRPISDEVK